jgi:hypothetical protein
VGATAWVYFTPYCSKPLEALKRLREAVFLAGQYRAPESVQERLGQLGPLPSPSQVHRQTVENLRRALAGGDSPEMRRMLAEAERLAEEAARREPAYDRLMQALRDGTLETLPEVQQWNASMREAFGPIPTPPQKPPRRANSTSARIAELLLRAGEGGTHSILDINRVGNRAAHATAFPLSSAELLEAFGTTEPTRDQVEASRMGFWEDLQWQAAYFAVYQEGSPAEWAFAGSSGD